MSPPDRSIGPTVVLVDKKTNRLHVAEYPFGDNEEYRILKTHPATIGEVEGDKEEEGDLKTPEGVYTFTSLLRPPAIKPKFGVMAFYIDFPNRFDVLAGRTGFDIMLHATDEPERLKKTNDSEGCVVVQNEQLEDIKPYIKVGLTPILIFKDLNEKFMRPAGDDRLRSFFDSWIEAWQNKETDRYVGHYHSEFKNGPQNREQYRAYKASLNRKYGQIEINPTKVQFFRHPKYSMIMFKQQYRSKFPNGQLAFDSTGTKIIYVAEEKGELKIISEDYSQSTW